MASIPPNYTSLFERLLAGKLSPEETDILVRWLATEEPDPEAAELVMMQLKQPVTPEQLRPAILEALDARLPAILARSNSIPVRRLPFLQRWMVAAAIIILFGIGVLLTLDRPSKQTNSKNIGVTRKDIAPGKAGAVLTLDNGKTVVLDSLGNGVIATQNGTKVLLKNGQLIYARDGSAISGMTYNTMTTPRGRQFELMLPDGSKVWLNAASSLRYPTQFTGKERSVEVTGEAYFEITKNAKMPFRVKVNNKTAIEVLGTHFNVNSYNNEATINTSLLEGSVRISNGIERAVLKPGQQAQVPGQPAHPEQVTTQSHIKIVSDVNMEKVMAWKNGVFNFQDATLKEVMRQLERWYDIDVVYEKDVPALEFMGKMGKDLTLSEVLRGLQMSEVHFRIEEGRKLVVMP